MKTHAVQLASELNSDAEAERRIGCAAGSVTRWRMAGYGGTAPMAMTTHSGGELSGSLSTGLVARAAADVAASRWEVIWRDRFPAAGLTVVAGAPGMGKSTLETAIASELSREGLVGIISNLEDDIEAVTVPRLVAAEADLSKVFLISPDDAPRLPQDLDRLDRLIASTGARYVILDPVAAHFTQERHVHDRRALGHLMAIARRHTCAVIGVHHTTKVRGVQLSAIEAIGGPQGGLSGAARAVYIYGRDPADEDRRAMACVKLNGMDRPGTLIMEHETVEVRVSDLLLEAGVLHFVDENNAAAEQLLGRGQTHRDRDAECLEWLTLFLAEDQTSFAKPSNEVRVKGKKEGFAWQTLLRSAIELGVTKAKVALGGEQFWVWRLPEGHPLRRAATADDDVVDAEVEDSEGDAA